MHIYEIGWPMASTVMMYSSNKIKYYQDRILSYFIPFVVRFASPVLSRTNGVFTVISEGIRGLMHSFAAF